MINQTLSRTLTGAFAALAIVAMVGVAVAQEVKSLRGVDGIDEKNAAPKVYQ